MPAIYSEVMIRGHLISIERLERTRWRVSVDGRRLFTFCSEARARDAGRLEAGRLEFVALEELHRSDPRRGSGGLRGAAGRPPSGQR